MVGAGDVLARGMFSQNLEGFVMRPKRLQKSVVGSQGCVKHVVMSTAGLRRRETPGKPIEYGILGTLVQYLLQGDYDVKHGRSAHTTSVEPL